jgi:hypothetical protein
VSILSVVLWAVLSNGPDLPPLRLEVLEGRAELATESGVHALEGPEAEREHFGPGFVRSSALSRVSLRWRGAATLDLEGAASVEWRASERSQGLSITLESLDRATLEVRRGPLRIELPGGWLAHLRFGAAFVRHLPDGSVRFEHVAGAPILLSRTDARDGARPPWTVLPGARLRLEESGEVPRSVGGARSRVIEVWARADDGARESEPRGTPWTGFAWPWGEPAERKVALEPRSGRRDAPWGPGWGRR